MLDSDEELVEQTLAGNRDAYAEVVSRYQNQIYNLAVRLIGDREEARDATQEVFIRAYANLRTYQRGRRFFPWLYRIGVNYCISHRRGQRQTTALDDVADLLPSSAQSPEEYAEWREDQQRLRDAIAKLPPHYRAVIVLRYGSDLPYEDIADVLQLPLGTVKTHLYRAKDALQRLLKEGEQ